MPNRAPHLFLHSSSLRADARHFMSLHYVRRACVCVRACIHMRLTLASCCSWLRTDRLTAKWSVRTAGRATVCPGCAVATAALKERYARTHARTALICALALGACRCLFALMLEQTRTAVPSTAGHGCRCDVCCSRRCCVTAVSCLVPGGLSAR